MSSKAKATRVRWRTPFIPPTPEAEAGGHQISLKICLKINNKKKKGWGWAWELSACGLNLQYQKKESHLKAAEKN